MSWGEAPQQPPYDPDSPYGNGPQQPSYPGSGAGGQQYPQQYPQPFPGPQPPPQGPYPGDPQPPQSGWSAPQPYGTGAGYTQPFPDQSYPYAQPGYPQPGPAGYPAPPPKKGNGALIAIVVGAVVVVGGGIAAAVTLTGGHGDQSPTAASSRTLAVDSNANTSTGGGSTAAAADLAAPSSVSGLTKLTGPVAEAAVSSMRSELAAESEEYPDPLLAAYNDDGAGNVTTILVDEPMDKLSSADQSQLTSAGSAAAVVSEIMSGAGVTDAASEATDASDGALSCGTKDESGTDVTICVWYDGATFGTLQYLDGTSPQTAAPVADAVRAAAEG